MSRGLFSRKPRISRTSRTSRTSRPPRIIKAAFLLLAICSAASMKGQEFDKWFADSTLRLDYVFAGNAKSEHIFFEQAFSSPRWAGRKARLAESFLRGNGQIVMRDHQSGETLFAHSFSTLFQEWKATEEAQRVDKAFETSYNVPFPRQAVDVTVTLFDFHNRPSATMTHTVDPKDILIRPMGNSGIPHYYIWKGGNKTVTEEKPESRNFMPTETSLDAGVDITGCIDLAIVAEGYTEQQMGKFYHDCERVVDALFAHEPFTSLKNRFNVVAVASASQESGPSTPHLGHWRHTAAATHYDTFYSNRYLMSQDIHHIYDLLAGVPFEHIIVLVNSDTYGGGGIYNQLNVSTSDHPTFRQVLVHEFGHGYAGLGDEYAYGDDPETMYPADTEPWEPNLTTLHDFKSKWADMVPQGTAIPTPADPSVPDYRQLRSDEDRKRLNGATQVVGVFEGGGYQTHGVYRPAQECRMKINEVEHFCPVCTKAIIDITDFYTSH